MHKKRAEGLRLTKRQMRPTIFQSLSVAYSTTKYYLCSPFNITLSDARPGIYMVENSTAFY